MVKRSLLLAALAASSLMISCGSAGDDGNAAQAELPLVDGLDSDADNQRLLFYVSMDEAAPGLYAFDPGQPERGGILVDGDLGLINPHYASMSGGTIDASGSTISDYHVASIFYSAFGTPPEDAISASPVTYGEQRRISTDPALLAEGPTRVSSTELSSTLVSATSRFRAHNLNDPMTSSLVIRTSEGWIRVRPSYDEAQAPDEFGENIEVVSTIWGPEVHQNAGWLVFDRGEDAQGNSGILRRVDDELNPVGDVHYKESGEVVRDVKKAKYIHDFADGTLLVALGIGSEESGQVWLYESPSAPGDGGTIKELLNQAGEPMVISFALMGIDGDKNNITAPASNLSSVTEDTLYFATGPSMFAPIWTHLYRVGHDGWTVYDHKEHFSGEFVVGDADSMANTIQYSNLGGFLIDVGEDQLFWSLGGQNEIVDVSSPDASQWTRTSVETPGGMAEGTSVYSSVNGWVYYNTRDDEAVALNVNSGESAVLADATWLGASASGAMSAINGQPNRSPISEVFLLRNGRQLAAVEAANPLAGMVVLGELAENAAAVRLFGVGAGPHRLAQVEYEDGAFAVVYMNTRREGSLKSLTNPVADWEKTFESGYSLEIKASETRPLNRF
jgi:hypothetical protein